MQPMPPGLIPDSGPPEISVMEFPDKHREAFTGLAYIGALSDTFEFCGHEISLRTLSSDENLAVALVTRDWAGTIGEQRAHYTALAGLCVTHVDGKPMPVPLGEGDDGAVPAAYTWCLERFNWTKAHWYQWTIDAIFLRFQELEGRVREIIDAMEKARAPTGPTHGSSITPGSASDEES